MGKPSTYRLSAEEASLVARADWMIMKRAVIEKVFLLFGHIHERLEALPERQVFPFPEALLQNGAKISRGENYRDLPYVILDYPRLFHRDTVFAFRTMFWWGRYFSCTLHLSGEARERFGPALGHHYARLRDAGFLAATGRDPWAHHLEEGNYRSLAEVDEAFFLRLLASHDFVKLSRHWPLDAWEDMPENACTTLGQLLEAMR